MEATTATNRKQKNQMIELVIATRGQVIAIDEKVKAHITRLTGITLFSSDENAYIGSTLDLTIDNNEIFPKGFKARWIRDREGVNVNQLPYSLDENGNNTVITGTYTDDTPAAVFPVGGYKVQILLTGYQQK